MIVYRDNGFGIGSKYSCFGFDRRIYLHVIRSSQEISVEYYKWAEDVTVLEQMKG